MKLVDITNGKLIEPGSEVTTFRGEKARLISATPPHRMGSAGKVLVEFEKDNLRYRTASGRTYRMEYYPSVIGAVFVEDRAAMGRNRALLGEPLPVCCRCGKGIQDALYLADEAEGPHHARCPGITRKE